MRIFRYMFITISLSLIALTLLTTYQISQKEIEDNIYSGTQVLEQTTSFIEYQINSIEGIIDVISYDDTIQTTLSYIEDYYQKDVSNWIIHTSSCREILYNSYITDNISKIRLYSSKGPASFEETDEFRQLSSIMQTEWYNRLNDSNQSMLWISGELFEADTSVNHDQLLYIKKISDMSRINRYLGYVTASVPKSTFSDIISRGEFTVGTIITIFNSSDEILLSNNPFFNSTDEIKEMISTYNLSTAQPLQKVHYKGDDYLIGIRTIQNNDWTISILIPYAEILKDINTYRKSIILSWILIIFLCLPLVYKLAASLNARIVLLKNMMADFSSGNSSITPIPNGEDEIGDLTNSFYHMQEEITKLLDERYRLGYEIKNLELQILQAQINPHFLYNTLDMIYWMGLKYECIEISEAAQKLGEFYMLSLGHGKKIVTIQDELRHVQVYVDIQNMRFDNRIILINNVGVEFFDYFMLKIILQPIIENAIIHGILERDDESGTITISAAKDSKCIYFYIEDNGVGIPPEKLNSLLVQNTSSKSHGYGIWNINERLHLSYGEPYGLRYESCVGKGTKVTVTLPIISDTEIE